MGKRNEGGQAFPSEFFETEHGDLVHAFAGSPGMTLRDYFAAMQMSRIGSGWPNAENMHRIAADCYAMADAMIAERSK